MSATSDSKSNRVIYYSQIFAGIGIGMLMGLIIGLSASPVVKSILGTLAGLLGVFLGLQDSIFGKKEDQTNELSPVILSSLRAGAFGVSCAIMIIFGLYLRVNDALGMPITEQVKRWTDAGYEKDLALDIALLEKMNLTSKEIAQLHEHSSSNGSGDSTSTNNSRHAGYMSTVLFSKEDLASIASLLSPYGYGDDAKLTLEEYRGQEIPQLTEFADQIEQNIEGDEDRIKIMYSASDLAVLISEDSKLYEELKDVLYSFDKAKQKSSDISILTDMIIVIERNTDQSDRDAFLSSIADIYYTMDL